MIRRERRGGGEGEERGLRNRDREKRDKRELSQFEEEDKEHRHLPLLISSSLLSSRLDSAVKRCSSEVLKFSFQRRCSVKGLARRNSNN